MTVDSGMLVVVTIIAMYMTLVFGLLFYVKNEWCDILHHNLTVRETRMKFNVPNLKKNLISFPRVVLFNGSNHYGAYKAKISFGCLRKIVFSSF